MLKQWIRQRKVSRLSRDLDSAAEEGDERNCDESDSDESDSDDEDNKIGNLMASAQDCYSKWKSHFESERWRIGAKKEKRSVTSMYFHWAGPGDIKRPIADEHFDRVQGISSSYQFFMLREGEVLMRRYSCWCPACFDIAMAGPLGGMLLSSYAGYAVAECTRGHSSFYLWSNKGCRAKPGASVLAPHNRAVQHGHDIAAHLTRDGGDWVLVEAFCDEEDEVWLGRTVAFDKSKGACKKKYTAAKPRKDFGYLFHKGNYSVAVQWYERLCESSDGQRREFVMSKRKVSIINSSELRLAGFDMNRVGEFPTGVSDECDAEAADVPDESSIEERQKWELSLGDESKALGHCR